ncbi:hypothetical protein DXG01_009060 [Tephrocybe rancida]|nr:hypothetical protein DXG01_009060 [Tephrocybe rancida]
MLVRPSLLGPLSQVKPAIVFPDLYEASVAELQAGLETRQFSSVDLVKLRCLFIGFNKFGSQPYQQPQAYFARIEEVNLNGPALRAVIETNPSAIAIAAALDLERKIKGPRSLLHGIPVLLKDNIATVASEGMNTTAGSFSLLGSVVPEDAGVVKRLRKAGAIILGKANLSEFSHYRGKLAPGWSGRGGQTTSAYFPNADPSGSSAGSGVAASIGLAAVTLGTETDGSITFPSSNNNVVGIKPTVGLTSRAGGIENCYLSGAMLLKLFHPHLVIPISAHQDTVGPMTRSMTDAAIVLSIIAGPDPNDNFTFAQPSVVPDFTKALRRDALKGKRIGVPRHGFLNGTPDEVLSAFEQSLVTLRELGATIIDPADLPSADEILASNDEAIVLNTDFKACLLSNPSGVRSLADLIDFNINNPVLERPQGFTDQSVLIEAEATIGFDAAYFDSLAADRELGSSQGIDAVLQTHKLDALVLPADVDRFTTTPSVPLGFFSHKVTIEPAGPQTVFPAPGIPFGLSFFGPAFSDFDLIGFAYAYEQKTQTRLAKRARAAAIPRTQLRDIVGYTKSESY